MKNLLYVSTSRTLLGDEILMEILEVSRRNNKLHNITGVLLYCEGSFIQVLEGDDDEVDTIFEKIERDNRHKNVIVMMNEPIEKRNFPNWAMGFGLMSDEDSCKFIDDITTTESIMSKTGDHPSIALLKAFIESNNLVVNH
ncbi:BLUF domain-containing protein [Mucilaginibacter pedocola]|uniref:BLUF domain-containing protein n=1 Tax=Mucilaginibacter pedocola TaxID=1792845 RepID=A0A1S9PEI1_9SPHI|nr:BLUF domain-containing protein [Mucilaginibacter pedocola]OOQ59354.1 hypothetical protein BC343_28070 [Mucilaginibacter pedocola]